MKFEETFTYDDVLLKPKFSRIKSRSEISLDVSLAKGFKFDNPIIPANMNSIMGKELAKEVFKLKGLAFLHRFSSIEDQIKILSELKDEFGKDIYNYIGVSIGVKEEDSKNIKIFDELGIKIICIDIAHLDSILGINMIKFISENYPKMLLIAGNIATGEAAARAYRAGADVVKVGIGASGICTTRVESAAGFPQLSAIMEVSNTRNLLQKEINRPIHFISDGGLREAGDCVKSLCFADMLMMGSYFAGCVESPTEEFEINGQKLKAYNGSSTHKSNRIEGIKALVKSKGSFNSLIIKLFEGIQSGCSYQDSFNLLELKRNPSFCKITNAGIIESKIHDIVLQVND